MRVPILGGVAWLALLAACDRTVDGNLPVGGDQPSQAETERFARRLHLDLTGGSPDDDIAVDMGRALLTRRAMSATIGLTGRIIASAAAADSRPMWARLREKRAAVTRGCP